MVDEPVDEGFDAVSADDALSLFATLSDRCAAIVAANSDWSQTGTKRGQYRIDLAVDDACVPPLLDAGYAVLSEESGLQWPQGAQGDPWSSAVVVVDPLDGSTNASLGLPWCATALCLTIDGVPTVGMVTNLVTGRRYHAVRRGGAWRDGEALAIESAAPLGDSVIAVSGLPATHYGWRQFRAMGASALDIAAVADGSFGGFVDTSDSAHGVWDYLAAALIVEEAGGAVVDAGGRNLVTFDHAAGRAPVAAASRSLLDELLAARSGTTS